jgi:hypothetical protein
MLWKQCNKCNFMPGFDYILIRYGTILNFAIVCEAFPEKMRFGPGLLKLLK